MQENVQFKKNKTKLPFKKNKYFTKHKIKKN